MRDITVHNDLLKLNFYFATLVATRRNIGVLLMVTAAILILDALQAFSDTGAGHLVTTTVTWCYLAFAAHAAVLKQTSGFDSISDNEMVWKFISRTAGLSLLTLPVAFVLGFSVGGGDADIIALAVVVFLLPSILLCFGFLGTMLPAIVARGDYSLRQSFKRGKMTFFYTAGRMIAGPGLVFIVMMAVAISYPFYAGEGELISADREFNAANLFPAVVLTLISAVNTVMFAVILSKAYIRGEEILATTTPTLSD
jgi:hypothetical protein